MASIILFNSESESYSELSNFHPSPFIYEGREYITSEQCYQAEKFCQPQLKHLVLAAASPLEAKRIAAKYRDEVRPDWFEVNVDVMRRIVSAKFEANDHLVELLLSTGNRVLVELSRRDRFWGANSKGEGMNNMGIILMDLRNMLQYKAMLRRYKALTGHTLDLRDEMNEDMLETRLMHLDWAEACIADGRGRARAIHSKRTGTVRLIVS